VLNDPCNFIDAWGLAPTGASGPDCTLNVNFNSATPLSDTTKAALTKIFANANVDINFQSGNSSADFQFQLTPLMNSSEPDIKFGQNPNGTNLAQVDYARIDNYAVAIYGDQHTQFADTAEGVIFAHEMGHVMLGPDHSPTGLMTAKQTLGIYKPDTSTGGAQGFTAAQDTAIHTFCLQKHPKTTTGTSGASGPGGSLDDLLALWFLTYATNPQPAPAPPGCVSISSGGHPIGPQCPKQ